MTENAPSDPTNADLRPGDETSADTPGAAENICPSCAGSGKDERGSECPDCAGTGKVTEGIGGG